MTAAAAKGTVERLLDIVIAGMAVLVEQNLRGHDDAVHAIAALRRLFFDERRLQGMKASCASRTLQRRDLSVRGRAHGHRARSDGLPIHLHRAGTALPETATEPRPLQFKVVTQDV